MALNLHTRPIPSMNLEGNIEKNWLNFKQQFEIYLIASEKDTQKESIQCALLLHLMGEQCIEIYNTFTFKDEERNKLVILLNKFNEYFTPKKNISFERYKYFNYKQIVGQSFNEYVTELKVKANKCNFGNLKEELIRDQIICGILNTKIRETLLANPNLTLEKAENICRITELAAEQATTITEPQKKGRSDWGPEEKTIVHEVKAAQNKTQMSKPGTSKTSGVDYPALKSNKSRLSSYSSSRFDYPALNRSSIKYSRVEIPSEKINRTKYIVNCSRCGRSHSQSNCPAFQKICNKCRKPNHFAKMCKTKLVGNLFLKESNGKEKYFLGSIYNKDNYKNGWYKYLVINNNSVKFKVDTGADINCIPINVFKRIGLNLNQLRKTECSVTCYSTNKVDVLGSITLNCKYNEKLVVIKFYIINLSNVPCILGLKTCQDLKIVKLINELNEDNLKFVEQYKIFEAPNYIKVPPVNIQLKDTYQSTVDPPRKVPFATLQDLRNELKILEKDNVIRRVTSPTDWVNSIVIVRKPNGKIRICMDPRKLNQAIKREHFPLPTIEHIASELKGAKYFSKLDASRGFWQLRLNKSSSFLCTFNTPFGRYRFLKLPFGICSAPEIFHRIMTQILDGLEGVSVYLDDILVWGENKQEHNNRLRAVLKKLDEYNVKLNEEKCKILVEEVIYIGHKFSKNGVQPDNSKIEAIIKMQKPENKKELEKFLGFVNYLSKFIKGYSELTLPLRLLLRKSVAWHWEDKQEKSFNDIKKVISNPPVLKYFDNKKDIVLSVDASQNCIGAVIIQEQRPIAYYSKSMTKAECNYAQIEKELLAIVIGCERYHQYIYGRSVTVETDHKPLVAIIKKSLSDCPLRLQRMLLRLQKYDIKLEYKPGKDLILADSLSRIKNTMGNIEQYNMDEEIEAQVGLIIKKIEITEKQYLQWQEETEKDTILCQLKNYIKKGWPDKTRVPEEIRMYMSVKDQLSVYNNILFKGDQMIVPKSMRKEILDKLHIGHFGIEKTKQRARDSIYWPGMNIEIENLIKKCYACMKYAGSQRREPMMSHNIPDAPWRKVGMDLFHFNGENYLIIVDYLSKYFKLRYLRNTSSNSVIHHIKGIFSEMGIPEVVISDNGPQFSSKEFHTFSMEWEFKHITSSPRYPQSNGLAERFVQTVKRTLNKCLETGTDPYLAMLELRNNPVNGEYSATEILLGRKIRGVIPNYQKNKVNIKNFKNSLSERQKKSENYYNKRTKTSKTTKSFKEQEQVLVQNDDIWTKGQIVEKAQRPRSYKLKMNNDQIIERNTRYIKEDTTKGNVKLSKAPLKEEEDSKQNKEMEQINMSDFYWKEEREEQGIDESEEEINENGSQTKELTRPQELIEEEEDRLEEKASSREEEIKYSSRGRPLKKTEKWWLHKK